MLIGSNLVFFLSCSFVSLSPIFMKKLSMFIIKMDKHLPAIKSHVRSISLKLDGGGGGGKMFVVILYLTLNQMHDAIWFWSMSIRQMSETNAFCHPL